jgi:L-asparaginase II
MTQTPLADPGLRAVDGCAIPTYAIPIKALARGFARFGAGDRLTPARAAATRRIREAVAAHPDMVAGTGRFDTIVMKALGLRAFVKTGAEGVYCAALPQLGLGLAVKADDGAARAAQVVIAALIDRFLPMDDEARARLAPFVAPSLRSWNGVTVGALRPASALAEPPSQPSARD